MKNLIRYIVLVLSFVWMVLVIALLPSCTPQKRLDRLLRNHPELLNYRDTVRFTDTFVVPKIKIDSVFSINFDTVQIVRDCVRVKLVKHRDTIRLTITKPADTVYKQIKVPVKKVQESNHTFTTLDYVLILLVLIILILVVYGSMKLPHKTEKQYYDSDRDN